MDVSGAGTAPTGAPGDPQVLVLVTGSARSGTSALAGSLNHLGYHVPQPMVPASERNAKGHFEPWFSIHFHKKHLKRAGVRAGDASPETQQRLAEVMADPAVRAELRDWLALQPEPRLVVKDPHAMRFLDVWAGACADLGIDLRYLTTVRHPAEVVGSRDLVWGQDRDDAERAAKEITNVAAWVEIALVTERETRGETRSFIRYDDLVGDWRTALGRVSEQLDLGLDTSSEPGTHELDTWLDPGMQRSSLTWEDLRVTPAIQALAEATWEQLDALCGDPRDASASQQLDEVARTYARLFAEARALVQDELRFETHEAQALVTDLQNKNRRLRRLLREQRELAETLRAAPTPPRQLPHRLKAALGRRLRG
ncbi:MAG: sulfotransferase [Nocardioides sp.]|nr:sulfotransferase [Nocardioides sp.]